MARASVTARVDEARLRAALVAAGRRLGARGLIAAGEGNLSIRLPGERLLVTPAGRRKDELAPDDLVIVELAPGRAIAPAPDRHPVCDRPRTWRSTGRSSRPGPTRPRSPTRICPRRWP